MEPRNFENGSGSSESGESDQRPLTSESRDTRDLRAQRLLSMLLEDWLGNLGSMNLTSDMSTLDLRTDSQATIELQCGGWTLHAQLNLQWGFYPYHQSERGHTEPPQEGSQSRSGG